MPTFTTNYNLDKPTPGGDDDSWGASLNAAMDKIDAALTALRIPVGGVYLSATDTDPATTLGYGVAQPHRHYKQRRIAQPHNSRLWWRLERPGYRAAKRRRDAQPRANYNSRYNYHT